MLKLISDESVGEESLRSLTACLELESTHVEFTQNKAKLITKSLFCAGKSRVYEKVRRRTVLVAVLSSDAVSAGLGQDWKGDALR